MGLLPVEYYRLTPYEFGLMYKGFLNKERKIQKNIREISWHIIKGYADPKDLPKTKESWWPIDESDLDQEKINTVNIDTWSDEKKSAALDAIKKITGG